MTDLHVLQNIIVVLGISVTVLVICGRLRLAPVIGLLLAGVVIGPSGLSLLAHVEVVETFAEVGVALLLFLIGLELSMEQMRKLRRIFFIGGVTQTVTTTLLVLIGALLLGFRWQSSLFFGFVVALSSTAVVLKSLQDRRESRTPQGRLALGLLLFQDFLVVPMIVVVPLLAGAVEATPGRLALRLGVPLVVIVVIFLAARYVMPLLLGELAKTRVRETFLLGALLIGLGMALITERLGFSLALGAFLAGLLISETDFGPQVIADIGPLRDLLASLFFLSIGMLVDLRALLANLGIVLAVALAMVTLKLATTALAVGILRFPARVVALSALVLAQVGEFSFVLLELGRSYELIDSGMYQLLLTAAVITLLATPLLIAVGPLFTRRLPLPAADGDEEEPEAGLSGHVVICGYGVNGQLLVRILNQTSIRYRAIEINHLAVQDARRRDEHIQFGDSTRPEVLRHAGVGRAKVVVIAISDGAATLGTIQLVRQLNPGATVLVRTRRVDEIADLRRAGADIVVAEEFETALELLTCVLECFHVPRHVIRTETRLLRGEGYEMLRAPSLAAGVNDAVLHALAAGTTDIFQVDATTYAAGKTLRELGLRGTTGTTVVAVIRGESPHLSPAPELHIEAGDTLVLVGAHAQIDAAFDLLARGPEESLGLP